MKSDLLKPRDEMGSGLIMRPFGKEGLITLGRYHVECRRPDGSLRWEDDIENLVTTAGANAILEAALRTGLAAPAWFLGLITGPGASNTYANTDTMAAHAGWTESSAYAAATRQAFVPAAAAARSMTSSASPASFVLNATVTLAGFFMSDSSTKGGATGTLLSEGNFTVGDRTGFSGDTLTAFWTITLT